MCKVNGLEIASKLVEMIDPMVPTGPRTNLLEENITTEEFTKVLSFILESGVVLDGTIVSKSFKAGVCCEETLTACTIHTRAGKLVFHKSGTIYYCIRYRARNSEGFDFDKEVFVQDLSAIAEMYDVHCGLTIQPAVVVIGTPLRTSEVEVIVQGVRKQAVIHDNEKRIEALEFSNRVSKRELEGLGPNFKSIMKKYS